MTPSKTTNWRVVSGIEDIRDIVGRERSFSSKWIRASLPLAAAVAIALLGRSLASSDTLSGTRSDFLPSAAAASSTLHVLVRVDIRAAEKHVHLADLMRNVRTIWEPYARIVFADSADPGGDGYDDEIQLVVSARPGFSASGASSLGWITFVAPGQPASFVTVSVASSRNLMAHSSWMGRPFAQLPLKLSQQLVVRALSWGAAHEIGHYLLRTSSHSRSGLMKGRLTAAEVIWNQRGLVRLEEEEVEILRLRSTHAGPAAPRLLASPDDEP